jgi:hypothetical protein
MLRLRVELGGRRLAAGGPLAAVGRSSGESLGAAGPGRLGRLVGCC